MTIVDFPCDLALCLRQPQNMPKTIAVRKAKETMAASTLSLVLSSIFASPAGLSRLSGAGSAAQVREST
jgi:hypothetical protein